MNLQGTRTPWIAPFEKHAFEVSGNRVTIVCPKHPVPGIYWAWKGEFLDAFPGTEWTLLEKRLYIVYLEFPDRFGCPEVE